MTKHALIVSPAPYKFATRSRKAAVAFAMLDDVEVTYLAPAKAGRTGNWDKAGRWRDGNVDVVQVECIDPRTEPSFLNQILNLSFCYIPALIKMVVTAIKTPANLVFVNGPSLIIIGLAHRIFHRSTLILDLPERPGALTARGSLATLIGRTDTLALRLSKYFTDVVTVVTYADIDLLKKLGFQNVELIRNVPMRSWKAAYQPPPIAGGDRQPTLAALVMGSIFEGRGYEKLIEAISLAGKQIPVVLTICGPARQSYRDKLQDLAAALEVEGSITFLNPVSPQQVSETYMKSDLGLVLYESNDPGNDGLSNKLFECVSSGRPVIASDLPENRKFIESTQVGWLAETSPDGIASALVEAYDSTKIPSIAQYCRELGESSLNWEDEFMVISKRLSNEH